MYSLKTLHRDFKSELYELDLVLNNLSNETKSYKRDIFIQGTFLRVVIIWENFIENSVLAAMCTCKTLSNTKLKPKIPLSQNKNDAFKKLSAKGRIRDRDYLDWIDYQTIKKRMLSTFHHRSRFNYIYRDSSIVNQIKAFRNHIAHNSEHSKRNFKEQIIQNVGYLSIIDPNAADILIATNRRTRTKFYEDYVRYYSDTADHICK